MGILIQVNGAERRATSRPWPKELNVTDDQKTKLAEIREANMRAMGEAFRDMRDQDLSREEMRAKFDELRDGSGQEADGRTDSEQQGQLEALKGEPVEIDMSQFRGFGGRGDARRPRWTRRPRTRGERNAERTGN